MDTDDFSKDERIRMMCLEKASLNCATADESLDAAKRFEKFVKEGTTI